MWDLIAYFVAMAFALLAMAFLIIYIASDVWEAKRYKRAARCQGMILENLGIEKVAFYGRHNYRKYGNYYIQFTYNGEVRNDKLLIKDRQLAPGDFVELHYEVGVHPLNDVCLRRVRELAIGFAIVLPLCLLFIYLEKNGMI